MASDNKDLLKRIDELEKENETVRNLYESLINNKIQKSKLDQAIFHKIKNSFQVVSSYSRLIKNEHIENRKLSLDLDDFDSYINETVHLCCDLLNYNKGKKEKTDFNLYNLIEESFKELKPALKEKNIDYSNEVDKNVKLYDDKTIVSLIVNNFLGNALKFSNENGKISIQGKEIKLKDQPYYEISVIDNGVGMDDKHLKYLFENYQSSQGTNGEKGSGLGLMINQYLVESNGGYINVESSPNKGSKFSFTLPLKEK